MDVFVLDDRDSTAYKLIGKLAALRQANDAVAYGTWKQRWINDDVYIYERQFFDDVVLVAINKSDTTSYPISGLNTALPAGNLPRLSWRAARQGNSLTVSIRQRWQQPGEQLRIAAGTAHRCGSTR